ncbi:MAG: HAD-IA family hydrolase [Acidobacteria bacterium]|nr:HAD-IA family hydrolase [Acidobacteriota bacterium]
MSLPRSDGLRAVSFDLGGTLISAWPGVGAIYADVCRAHDVTVSAEECHRGFEAAWARRAALAVPGRDRFSSFPGGEDGWWGGVVAEVLASCGVDPGLAPGVEAFREAFASPGAWRIYDDVLDALDALRAAGYRLAILSNWDSRMTGLLERLSLTPRFDALLCSAVEGMEKPHPEFFARLSRELGVPPPEILHIGDLVREDYLGARAAGMRALWLDRRGEGAPSGAGVEPDDVVTSIGEVARRLTSPARAALGEAS